MSLALRCVARSSLMAGLLLASALPARGDEVANRPVEPRDQDRASTAKSALVLPIVVFFEPGGGPAEVAAARVALARVAERAGAAFLDLSPAPEDLPSAATELDRGIEAFRAFEYDSALAALTSAVREAAQTGAGGLSASELSDLHIYRGLVFAQRGDTTRSWDDFVAAATLDPTRRLDPGRYSPRVIETFERAVKAVTARPYAGLTVVAASDCAVFLDSNRMAPGEARSLPRGYHYVRVTCAGFLPYGSHILIQQDSEQIAPSLREVTAPSSDELRQLARRRGSNLVLSGKVILSGNLPPTLVLQAIEVASGRVAAQRSVVLDPASTTPDTERAADELLQRTRAERAAVALPSRSRDTGQQAPQPWYHKPWVWGVAGATLTAIVITPFLVDWSPSRSGFEVRPGGSVPPRMP